MREIKFRAWDNVRRAMIGGDGHSDEGYKMYDQDLRIGMDFMQFIGLKDKSGKEIFEGDIIAIHNQGDYREQEIIDGKGEVKFDDGCYKLFGFYAMNLGKKVCSGSEGNWNMEVIGNIYENADLLK